MKILLLSTAIVFLLSSCDNATMMMEEIPSDPIDPQNSRLLGTWDSVDMLPYATTRWIFNPDGSVIFQATFHEVYQSFGPFYGTFTDYSSFIRAHLLMWDEERTYELFYSIDNDILILMNPESGQSERLNRQPILNSTA